MSGGHFSYSQYKIAEIYDSIEEYLNGREVDEDDLDYHIEHYGLGDKEAKFARKHLRTIPNPYGYSKETITEFKKAVHILKQAEIYAQRIDWLLSGDDGEENFHKRLKDDLEKLNDDGTDEARQETTE